MTRIGRYEIGALQREDVGGAVYRGRDRQLDRPVAIRLLDEERCSDPTVAGGLQDEISDQARLLHPNIVTVLDYFTDGRIFAIVTEDVSGDTLEAILDRAPGPVPLARAVRWINQILGGLGYAHERGTIHGGLTPSQVLMDEGGGGTVRVADFGLLRALRAAQPAKALAYLSPEQMEGGATRADVRSDLYSCGALLYRLLSGFPPFEADSDFAIMELVVKQPLPDVGALPVAITAVLRKAMEKAPADRFQSALEMQSALMAALPVSVSPNRPSEGPRRLLDVAVAGAGIGTLIALAILLARAKGSATSLGAPLAQSQSQSTAAILRPIECPSDMAWWDLPEPKPGRLLARVCETQIDGNRVGAGHFLFLKTADGLLNTYLAAECEARRIEKGQTIELEFERERDRTSLVRASLANGGVLFAKTDCVTSEGDLQSEELGVQAAAERDRRLWERASALGPHPQPSRVDVRSLAGTRIAALLDDERLGPFIRSVFGHEGIGMLERNSGTTSGAVMTPEGELSLYEFMEHVSSESTRMIVEPSGHVHAIIFTDDPQPQALHFSSNPAYFGTVFPRFAEIADGQRVIFHRPW